MTEYELRPREDYCDCSHHRFYHGGKIFLFFFWLLKQEGKECHICKCSHFNPETKRPFPNEVKHE